MDEKKVADMQRYIANLEEDERKLRRQRPLAKWILWIGLLLSPLGLFVHWLAIIFIAFIAIVAHIAWRYIGYSHEKEIADRLRNARERYDEMQKV